MPQSIYRVRSWVEYWSWHIPVGSAHGCSRRRGAADLWWGLVILPHPGCVDLTLSVCNPVEVSGCLVTNTRRQVTYDVLSSARDYVEFVGVLNAELRKLFAEAGAMPPSLLPNGRLGVRELG
jgi:hypothetical protein